MNETRSSPGLGAVTLIAALSTVAGLALADAVLTLPVPLDRSRAAVVAFVVLCQGLVWWWSRHRRHGLAAAAARLASDHQGLTLWALADVAFVVLLWAQETARWARVAPVWDAVAAYVTVRAALLALLALGTKLGGAGRGPRSRPHGRWACRPTRAPRCGARRPGVDAPRGNGTGLAGRRCGWPVGTPRACRLRRRRRGAGHLGRPRRHRRQPGPGDRRERPPARQSDSAARGAARSERLAAGARAGHARDAGGASRHGPDLRLSAAEARRPLAGLGLAGLCLLVWLPGFAALPAVDRDESRFLLAARTMAASGDWVVPHLDDRPRLEKPPLATWLQAATVVVATGGHPERDRPWMGRLSSLLAALATVLALWRLGGRLVDPRAAWLAALLLGLSPLVVSQTHQARADLILLLPSTLCLLALARVWRSARRGRQPPTRAVVTFWLALMAAVLAKGPITPWIVAATVVGLAVAEPAGRRWRWLAALAPGTRPGGDSSGRRGAHLGAEPRGRSVDSQDDRLPRDHRPDLRRKRRSLRTSGASCSARAGAALARLARTLRRARLELEQGPAARGAGRVAELPVPARLGPAGLARFRARRHQAAALPAAAPRAAPAPLGALAPAIGRAPTRRLAGLAALADRRLADRAGARPSRRRGHSRLACQRIPRASPSRPF